MRILLSGAGGFIGQPLHALLHRQGHEVIALVRKPQAGAICWNPEKKKIAKELFEGFDAVIHLAGENISGRWTAAKKKAIYLSRVQGTWLLSQVLSELYHPPRVFISPSGVGYYGDRGEEELTEASGPGSGFLAETCIEWEKAAQAISDRNCRTLHPRFGTVIGPRGGALQKLLPIYRCGLGGRLGSGRQWMSWVSLQDACRAILFALSDERLEGAFNVTAPQPVRQEEFCRRLAARLHRLALLPQPAWLLKLLLGEMAKELLLSSARVYPEQLQQAGFSFQHFTLDNALIDALK